MSYGVEVFNDNGTLIINEEYSNYVVVASGTSANGTYGWSGIATGDDLVWVRPHTAGGSIYYDRNTYGKFISSTGSIKWVVTRRNPAVSAETFGLRVYTAAGAIAYDSGRAACVPVMNARDTAGETSSTNINAIPSTTVNAPFSPLAGRQRYVAFGCFESFLRWLIDDAGAAYTQGSKITWTSETQFQMTSVANLVSSNGAAVIYSKPVGAINYFWADFTV